MEKDNKQINLSRKRRAMYRQNIKALAQLEYDKHLVSPKGPHAALIDNRYVVYMLEGRYRDMRTGRVSRFKPGDMGFVV